MKYLAALFFVFWCFNASSQNARLKAIKINRVEVKEEQFGDSFENVVRLLSLEKRNYKGMYDYWRLPSAYVSNLTNLSGSLSSYLKSKVLSIDVKNNNQELVLQFSNNSDLWIGIELSSFNFFISYSVNNKLIEYPMEDYGNTMGVLFNYERGEYNYVLLPPGAETTCKLFRIDGIQKGYDLIHSCIKDGSCFDFEIPFMVYENNPFDAVKSEMISQRAYQYAQYTPVMAYLDYKGGYYKEGEAIHVHNDYTDLVRPRYSFYAYSGILKIRCEIDFMPKSLPIYKNRFGLYVFDK